MQLWVLRIFFLLLCITSGYMISQVRPEWNYTWYWGVIAGFGFGGLLIAIDEMVKGLSLRAFSSATFGLILGTIVAWLIDQSQLFQYVDEKPKWLIRLSLFVAFSYIGMILAMRSNKEDFSLIIPYVRFQSQNKPENLLLLDTSAIIDGRITALIESNFLEGIIVVPRFILKELHQVADSNDPVKRARGRHGLEMLSRIRRNEKMEVKIHEGDYPNVEGADAKLVHLAKATGAKLYTCDYNLSKIAELQSVDFVLIQDLANALKKVLLPGETMQLQIVKEGKDKGQGVGYLNDGTMVVVNEGEPYIGKNVQVQILSLLQTGAGTIVFADLKQPPLAA